MGKIVHKNMIEQKMVTCKTFLAKDRTYFGALGEDLAEKFKKTVVRSRESMV